MTETKNSTIEELAEVIADQQNRIRELSRTVEEQCEFIVEYELAEEEQEKRDAAIYTDLLTLDDMQDILERYFSDYMDD